MTERNPVGIQVEEITRIRAAPDVYVGTITFNFAEIIDGGDYGHTISVKLRIKHSRASSVEALEVRFREEALGLLTLALQSDWPEIV